MTFPSRAEFRKRCFCLRRPSEWVRFAGRQHARNRSEKATLLAITVLVAGAIAVRAWLMVDYSPAFVGFGDSHEYVSAAALGVFRDVQKPAGYPIFLGLAHLVSSGLTFTIFLQHALGVATGLLLYKSVQRAGAPPWLGLLPAAVVFFGGTGLLLEHSLLADSLFAFLQALGVYTAVRAISEPRLRWALLTGLAIGISFWVKTVALSSLILVPPLLLLGACGTIRRRLLSGAAVAGVAIVVILGYAAVQAQVTGYWGYERQGAWNLYGRVATFVNCADFTPPAGTRFLCPREAPGHRLPPAFFQYSPLTPAVRHFGGPAHAPSRANALLQKFSIAAIEHQPIAYAAAILKGLTFFLTPRSGEGYTPESIREALLAPAGVASIQPSLARYYPGSHGYRGPASATHSLATYESHTRVQGVLLVLMLLACVLGIPLLSGRVRSAAILFALTAIFSVTFAVAGNSYDARYGYPAFGPLAAGAAIGAWGITMRIKQGKRTTI
jgi:hypothetical protein